MHTPSKFCTRLRSPSTTLTPTRSVSPGRNSGTGLSLGRASIASFSRVSIRWLGLPPPRPHARPAASAGGEFGDRLVAGQGFDRFFLERLDQVHWSSPSSVRRA